MFEAGDLVIYRTGTGHVMEGEVVSMDGVTHVIIDCASGRFRAPVGQVYAR